MIIINPYRFAAPAATNLLGNGNDFTSWNNTRLIATPGQSSYDGTNTATKIAATTDSNATHWYYKLLPQSASGSYIYSLYAKAAGLDEIELYIENASGSGTFTAFNLSTNSIVFSTTSGSTMTPASNGYINITMPYTLNGTQDMYPFIMLTANSAGREFTGDGTSGVLIAGATLVKQ